MHIILVSERLAKPRTITIRRAQLAWFGVILVAVVLAASGTLYQVASSRAPDAASFDQVASNADQDPQAESSQLRETLSAMAVKVGQMQAKLMRLDSLGERLAKAAGVKPNEIQFDQMPGRGGAVSSNPQHDFSLDELNAQLETLARQVDQRDETLGMLESLVTMEQVQKKLLPSFKPVASGWHSSRFGWRIDPFTGHKAMHEGMDFVAEAGTPIFAAAGGVVSYAGRHPQYGNMIDIAHGNDLVSRYAHASRLLVRVGDFVQSGGKIAEVGSTGRSTGAHLHFEVHHKGIPQNPARFLNIPG